MRRREEWKSEEIKGKEGSEKGKREAPARDAVLFCDNKSAAITSCKQSLLGINNVLAELLRACYLD